ncbi:MAG TPA: phosphotransferase [Ktedonobacteraceae bacterium]|nr:phosphotransferase [Ktedonobacteraceae bacterium]
MSHVSRSVSDRTAITAPFPVAYSVLSPMALHSEVLSRYALGDQVSCVFWARGVNDTYLVQTHTKKYILRVYHAGWRTLSDILYEIDVLHHLDRAGVPISTPVAQSDGNVVSTLQAPEGPRQVVLFTYAPGRALDRHDATDSYYHGGALAALHNATSGFASIHRRNPLDLNYLIDQSLQAIEPLHTCSSADWEYLQALAERLRLQVQQFSQQGLDWGVCHGDCNLLNDHIDADQSITFFDFDCCAEGWRAYELAIVRWCEGFYHMDPDDTLWHAFLKGYTEQRIVSENDLASIPTFVALREIWHTALIAWLQPDSGIQGFDKILQRTIRLLREWETTQIE